MVNALRLLHFSDLHLGVELYGRLDPATGLNTRVLDFLGSLDRVVDYALSQDIHLVLFSGDAYKDRTPNLTLQREFAKRIRRLAEGVPVFLLLGNHDRPGTLAKANTVEIFSTLQVPQVYVAAVPEVYHISTKSGPVQIVALPWTRRLSHAEDEKEALRRVESFLEQTIAELDPQIPAILAAHAMVSGARFGSERSVFLGEELVLPKSLLVNTHFAYVALGHIHKHQVLAENPPVVYAGSMERVDFSEEKEEKGFVVAEIMGSQAKYQFIPLPARPFVTIRVEIKDGADPTAQVLAAIAQEKIEGAVVRVEISASQEVAEQIRDAEIRRTLDSASHVASIQKNGERPTRLRLGSAGEVENLTPAEIVARYLETKKVPKKRQKLLLDYARKIMDEGE